VAEESSQADILQIFLRETFDDAAAEGPLGSARAALLAMVLRKPDF